MRDEVLRQARMELNVERGQPLAPQLLYQTYDDVVLDHHYLLPNTDGVHAVARSDGIIEVRDRSGTVQCFIPASEDANLKLAQSGLIITIGGDAYIWGYYKSLESVPFLLLV
jgi:hypothetical protein